MVKKPSKHVIKKKPEPRMIEAAAMAAEGKKVKEIAAHFNVCETTVRTWLRTDSVKAEYLAIIRASLLPMVAKAVKVLDKQMDSDNANGFLAQNAASNTLTRYGASVLEEEQNTINITFTNGAIEIGMPDADEEE